MCKNRNGVKVEKICGSEEVTRLPDHVIADRRCQNAAEEEESMHGRQRREKERERTRQKDKKGQKKAGEKRGQFRCRQKLSRKHTCTGWLQGQRGRAG